MTVHTTFYPNNPKVEAERSLWVQGHHGQHREIQDSQNYTERPCLSFFFFFLESLFQNKQTNNIIAIICRIFKTSSIHCWEHAQQGLCGAQKTTFCDSVLSYHLGSSIKTRLSGLVAGAFTLWAISLGQILKCIFFLFSFRNRVQTTT